MNFLFMIQKLYCVNVFVYMCVCECGGVSWNCVFICVCVCVLKCRAIQVAETEKAKAYSPKKDPSLIMNCEATTTYHSNSQ